MSMTERKLKQKSNRQKRASFIPPSIKKSLSKGKHYTNYLKNQATRRLNPNARKIKSSKITSTW